MGFLEIGSPIPWAESLAHLKYVRRHGVLQFISTYNRLKSRTNDVLKWGDEVRTWARGFGAALRACGGRSARSATSSPVLAHPPPFPRPLRPARGTHPHSFHLHDSSPTARRPAAAQIEYHLVEIPSAGSSDARAPRLALIAPEILEQLNAEDAALSSAR